ncbi:MAG: DUF2442 domain-containing protein [Chitinophagales bacterium]
MLIKVTTAKHLKEYKLELSFNDGLRRTIDLKKHLAGPIYQPLKNVEYFKSFTLNRWTIEWENGADFAPEFLHKLALEQNPKSDKQLTSK